MQQIDNDKTDIFMKTKLRKIYKKNILKIWNNVNSY